MSGTVDAVFDRRTDLRIAQIVRRQHGVIARRQLLDAGLSAGGLASRVRHHRLFPVIRGVYALGSYVDVWGGRCAAVLAAGGDPLGFDDRFPGRNGSAAPTGDRGNPRTGGTPDDEDAKTREVVVLSHWSAAHAYGLIDHLPSRHHVTSVGPGTRRQAAVRIHRTRALPPADARLLHGVPTTTPARTILDLAAGEPANRVRRLIREAEFLGLVADGDMTATVRRNPRHLGARIVRIADPSTAESQRRQTPIEDLMRAVLERTPLPTPVAQQSLTGASGRPYRADFAWPDLRLIVETDGRTSHDRSTSFQDDRARDADLAAAGWLTLRFTWLQLHDPGAVAATILATARTRSRD